MNSIQLPPYVNADVVLLCFAQQSGQEAFFRDGLHPCVLDRSADPPFIKVPLTHIMWDEDSDYDNYSESDKNSDQDEEEESYEPYDPNDMTYRCRYGCSWNNDWCNFDVTTPQLNWSRTESSTAASPALPPGVTAKVHSSILLLKVEVKCSSVACRRPHSQSFMGFRVPFSKILPHCGTSHRLWQDLP